ncbi:MAG TPA: PDZ domain-containing protein [Verrucomicrobiae bacterium]|jgi:serine protease Do
MLMTLIRSWLNAALLLALPVLTVDAAHVPAPRLLTKDSVSRPASAGDDATRAAIQRAVDAVYPALVRIHVVYEEGQGGRMQKNRASGSGTIIDAEGHILTNHHVAGRATRIVCRLSNREEVDATLVGTDPLSDLAVLQLDLSSRRDPRAKLPVAKFGNSDELMVGDVVLSMGSPAGLSQSVTKGIVANTAMIAPGGNNSFTLDGEKVGELVRWIGHDAVIFPGNSGGPLVNLKGKIIGVNEVGIGSLGGAIPANLAQGVAKELIRKGSVSRSWIGLEAQPLLKNMSKETGILVAHVLPDSPAKQAGIQPGDSITDYNGTTVPESRAQEDIPLFNRMVLTTPVGAKVTLKGTRAGQPKTWHLITTEREPNEAREVELANWGLTIRNFTRASALENQRKDKQGAQVDSVRQGWPAAETKPPLRTDDIITKVDGKPVAGVESLQQFTREFVKGLSEPKPLTVTFERDAQELMTVVKIGPEVPEDKPARPAKAWLGVQTQVLTTDLAEALGLEGKKGVRITFVMPDSPAEKSGIKTGDIFLKLDGQVIAASTQADQELFDNLVRQYKVGSEAELQGVRAGQPLTLAVTLGKLPKPAVEMDEHKDERFEFSARDMTLADRVSAKLADSEKGVRLGSVQNAGWAALAGLSSGDILLSIDGEQIESIAALKKIMAKLYDAQPRRVIFFVKRGIRTMFAELEPKW